MAYNVIESIDQEKHREIKKWMRFKMQMDKEKLNRLWTESLLVDVVVSIALAISLFMVQS